MSSSSFLSFIYFSVSQSKLNIRTASEFENSDPFLKRYEYMSRRSFYVYVCHSNANCIKFSSDGTSCDVSLSKFTHFTECSCAETCFSFVSKPNSLLCGKFTDMDL
jgi:hypothetical protein